MHPLPSWADPLIGSMVGDFLVEKILGEGGMGRVYAGTDPRTSRRVAIKVIADEHARDAELVGRFYAEANAASRIRHPSIIEVLALTYLGDGRPAIVMELVEGQTLREMIANGPVPLDAALDVIGQVLDAISAAHGAGIIHRDLKPDNVVITPKGLAKVLDFGIAKLASGDIGHGAPRTRTGMMLGTPDYMAPEQITGTAIDGRTDIYAMGAMLYETLTGKRPFEAESQFLLLRAHLEMPPPWIGDVRADVPDAISRIAVQAMAKLPGERFATPGAMRDALIVAKATGSTSSTPASFSHSSLAVSSVASSGASSVASSIASSIASSGASSIASPVASPVAHAAPTAPPFEPARPPWRLAIIGAVCAIVAIVVIAMVVVKQRRATPSPTPSASAPIASAPVSAPTPAPAKTSDGIERVTPEVTRFPPPKDVAKYDLDSARPSIESLAREMLPDAQLYYIDADNVHADGTVDMSTTAISLMYASPSIAAKRPVDLAANQPFRDKCQVVAHLSAQMSQVVLSIDNCTKHPPAPKCTLRQIWERAQKQKHANPKYVARITFVDGSWDFRIYNVPPDDEVQLISPDNCPQ